jgi:hypothetical protein
MKKVKKFALVKEAWLLKGEEEYNIDYAIDAIIEGIRKKLILENLISDYRKMSPERAENMLSDLYANNSGEFTVENKRGYVLGGMFFFAGILSWLVIYFLRNSPGFNYRGPGKFIYWLAIGGTLIGGTMLISAISGKYREE